MNKKLGFTLMELLIVITLIGILSGLIFSLLRNAAPAARDIKRKQDLESVKKALDIYYNDAGAYPTQTSGSGLPWGGRLSNLVPTKTYIERLPADPVSTMNYFYSSSGQSFKIYACLENDQDIAYTAVAGGAVSANCGSTCAECHYGISSENTTP